MASAGQPRNAIERIIATAPPAGPVPPGQTQVTEAAGKRKAAGDGRQAGRRPPAALRNTAFAATTATTPRRRKAATSLSVLVAARSD